MTIVLVVVAVGWIIFIGSLVKERMRHRVGDSVHSFRDQLTTLERRVGPRRRTFAPLPYEASGPCPTSRRPRTVQEMRRATYRAELRKRRRDVLFGLVGIFAFSLLLVAMAPGAVTVLACLACAGLLGGYIALLARAQRLALERRSKVHYLDNRRAAERSAPEAAATDLLLRHTATS